MGKKHSEKSDKKNDKNKQQHKNRDKQKNRTAPDAKVGDPTGKALKSKPVDNPSTDSGASDKPATLEKSKAVKKSKTIEASKSSGKSKQAAEAKNKIKNKAARDRAADSRKGRIDKSITNREFKLLLKPDGLERRKTVAGYQTFMQDFCKQQKVEYLPLETAATGLRNVTFYDTPDEDLRGNRVILRVRASRKDLWVDEWCEVTLKRRHDDFETAAAFDPKPHFEGDVRTRMRFKEEILRGSDPDQPRSIYSNNAIINTVPIDRLNTNRIGEIYSIFPGLKALEISADKNLGKVGGAENTILEACLPLGMITFDDEMVAHCDLGVWFRSAGVPLVAELAYAYHVNPKNRKNRKAHIKANRFFARLQEALRDHLYEGSTKTALVYGKPE